MRRNRSSKKLWVKREIIKHKAKVLTKEQISKGRSNAYKYLDL